MLSTGPMGLAVMSRRGPRALRQPDTSRFTVLTFIICPEKHLLPDAVT